jgi:hypothetical protein
MGLIRALIFTVIIYFVWSYVKTTEWMNSLPPEMKQKITEWILIGLIFLIELF